MLLDDKYNLKVVDFGFTTIDGLIIGKNHWGTQSYMAPEIIERKSNIGMAVDIYASGIVLFSMISGHYPFDIANKSEDYKYKAFVNSNSSFWRIVSSGKPSNFYT